MIWIVGIIAIVVVFLLLSAVSSSNEEVAERPAASVNSIWGMSDETL